MSSAALAELRTLCPVKGSMYRQTLAIATDIKKPAVARFLSQWYAFSSSVPELLCIAAMKASCEEERSNIVANLYSELGLDSDGTSHPELLKDLIEQATGEVPSGGLISQDTRLFLEHLRRLMLEGSSAYNAGVMLALEAVAYSILSVLREILEKSGNAALTLHPYIVIHEEVEAGHIDNTEENIALYKDQMVEINQGYADMTCRWLNFWNSAYETLVTPHG